MKAQNLFYVLLPLLLLVGCATSPVIQVEGRPVPDHVLQASLLQSEIKVEVAFIRYYGQPEGDELLETHQYLRFGNQQGPSIIAPTHLRKLEVFAKVFNPRKVEYQLWIEKISHQPSSQSKQRRDAHLFTHIYAGNLSRKEFHISLPLDAGGSGSIQLLIRDKDEIFIYQSPKASYEVGKIRGSSHN